MTDGLIGGAAVGVPLGMLGLTIPSAEVGSTVAGVTAASVTGLGALVGKMTPNDTLKAASKTGTQYGALGGAALGAMAGIGASASKKWNFPGIQRNVPWTTQIGNVAVYSLIGSAVGAAVGASVGAATHEVARKRKKLPQ